MKMESIVEKLLIISKIINLSESLRDCERIVKQNHNVNDVNENFVKTLKISVE